LRCIHFNKSWLNSGSGHLRRRRNFANLPVAFIFGQYRTGLKPYLSRRCRRISRECRQDRKGKTGTPFSAQVAAYFPGEPPGFQPEKFF
jgi:hypothetical protein